MKSFGSFAAVALLGLVNSACQPVLPTTRVHGLVYCAEGSPESFNPQLVTSGTTIDAISQHLYDRLLDIDADSGELLPGLAQSWTISEDGLTYRFQLRQGVEFHQTRYFSPTRTMNADDVQFTFDRLLSVQHPFHQTATEYPYFDSVEWQQLVAKLTILSPYQIEFTLTKPDSSFLSTLATDFAAILSAEYGAQLVHNNALQNLDQLPVGTGPFLFRNYQKDVLIRYYRHPKYWRQLPAMEQLVIDIVPDNTKRIAKLLTHECDVAPIPRLAELSLLSKRDDFVVDAQTSMNVGYWAFNTRIAPFNQVKVRQALSYAINKSNIMQAVYFGQAEPANSLLPPTSWAYDKNLNIQGYDPLLAKKLLAEAGYPQGFQMDIWAMPVQRLYNPNALKMAELIQADLAQIGVQAKIVSFEWNTFRRKLRSGEHDSVLIGWSADNADPDNFLRPLLSCAAAISGSNRANWCDETYDELIAKAVQTPVPEERRAFYSKRNNIRRNRCH
ncbi:MAG: ABC transporter substrate-binding protein [Rheinheimera sp.]